MLWSEKSFYWKVGSMVLNSTGGLLCIILRMRNSYKSNNFTCIKEPKKFYNQYLLQCQEFLYKMNNLPSKIKFLCTALFIAATIEKLFEIRGISVTEFSKHPTLELRSWWSWWVQVPCWVPCRAWRLLKKIFLRLS